VIVHVALATLGVVVAAMLVVLSRDSDLPALVPTALGAFTGALSGAGIALGLGFQSTTANIHSGYSFAGVGRWLVLAAGGGVIGAIGGGLLGRQRPGRRSTAFVLLAAAVVSAAGWVIAAARPTIDCDERPSFCEQRYG
jgi:hypothetical protein